MHSILGTPMIGRQIERIRRAKLIDRLVVATSIETTDDVVAAYCASIGVAVHRGPLIDALTRFLGALAEFGPAEHVVRLTADCPLTDWDVIDACIRLHLAGAYEFTSNAMKRTYPAGLDVEVMTVDLLARLSPLSVTELQREHVTQVVYDRHAAFHCGHLVQSLDESTKRWTVDTPADFAMAEAVYAELYPGNPAFKTAHIRALLDRRPDIAALHTIPAKSSM